MIKFLADENFDHKTLAGLRRREPGVDIVAVREVGLREVDDLRVLEWAADDERAPVEASEVADLRGLVALFELVVVLLFVTRGPGKQR